MGPLNIIPPDTPPSDTTHTPTPTAFKNMQPKLYLLTYILVVVGLITITVSASPLAVPEPHHDGKPHTHPDCPPPCGPDW
ncbi:hypothetical protein PM082_019198 [Marasmius tenuissimus]|nr:hypothetical protein PM082_019198 [Marasmius tenuissimus]